MLLTERTDALTAMGTSMALVWNNLPVMLTWGAIMLVLFVLGIVTGLLGLIVVFPVLGHGTWHAYRAMRPKSWRAASGVLSDELLRFGSGVDCAAPDARAAGEEVLLASRIVAEACDRPTCRCRRFIAAPACGRSSRRSAGLPAWKARASICRPSA